MPAFNTVIGEATCPVCKHLVTFEVQFKYGGTWQYVYHLGESLKWGRNDIGNKDARCVLVEGIGNPCPNCGTEFIDFDVLVKDNVLVRLEPIGKSRPSTSPQGFIILDDNDPRCG